MKVQPRIALLGGASAFVLIALVAALYLGSGDDAPPADAVVIDVTTARYAFTPGSDAPITVPEGSRVVLRVTSADVTHGFAIDGYGVSKSVPAGETIEIAFTASKAGEFTIYCNVFCGGGHPEHKGTLHVV